MRKPEIITYKGKTIVFLDYSNLKTSNEIIALIDEGSTLIRSKPVNSVLSMVSVQNMYFNNEVRNALQENVKMNNPHVKKSVVYGLNGLISVMYNSFIKFTGRNMKSVKTKEEALEYLVS
ncbi:MAG: hypothetical protein ACERKD_08550 [Prolixibacteraceae bacterium]